MVMLHEGAIIALRDDLRVMDCRVCGYAHLHPLPDNVYVKYTQDAYYPQERFQKVFSGECGEHQTGTWDAAYDYQIRLLNRDLPLVDVGSGMGWFARYWEWHTGNIALGIEPSPTSRKNSVHQHVFGDISELYDRYPWTRYNMNVRMSLVLEHVLDPVHIIEMYKVYLGKCSKLLVKVPHDGPTNPLQRHIGGSWWVDKTHVNYFNPKSLEWVFNQAGLRVTHISTTFPIELAQLLGWRYVGNEQVGDQVHHWRLRFEKKLGWRAFTLYRGLYKVFGWGRELIMCGKSA